MWQDLNIIITKNFHCPLSNQAYVVFQYTYTSKWFNISFILLYQKSLASDFIVRGFHINWKMKIQNLTIPRWVNSVRLIKKRKVEQKKRVRWGAIPFQKLNLLFWPVSIYHQKRGFQYLIQVKWFQKLQIPSYLLCKQQAIITFSYIPDGETEHNQDYKP